MTHHRGDAAWLVAAWQRARLLRVDSGSGTALVDDDGALVLFDTAGADRDAAMLLGVEPDGVAVFAVDGPLPVVSGARARSLREVGHRLSDRDAGLFTTALAIANWHAGHPYSSITGLPTMVRDAGWSRVDEEGNQLWPRTDPAMIVLLHDGMAGDDGRCLLGSNAAWPKEPGVRRFSCLAGYVEPGESAEAAVAREIHEEVGIEAGPVTYVASQAWPFPGSLMLAFTAVTDPAQPMRVDEVEITHARWFTRREIRAVLAGAAVDSGDGERVSLPPPVSIAYYLISRWLRGGP